LDSLAPAHLAEAWDNTGLLVGDPAIHVDRLMTCLTITPESASEAIDGSAQMIVTHHPLPFRALKRLTTATTSGRLLWRLIRSGISIYSPHTAFDSTTGGINELLAQRFDLADVQPLMPTAVDVSGGPPTGAGRRGRLQRTMRLDALAAAIKSSLGVSVVQAVGNLDQTIERVAVACGSGSSFIEAAVGNGCDALVTGEASFHHCLEARAQGLALILVGHFASERFALEVLAQRIHAEFPRMEVWASRDEADPVTMI
jgi:dinuclear metal center YbgI/SA1388 family protein